MNPPTVWLYLIYLIISILLTVWVARTLHKNGRIFLVDCFGGNEPMADSVNHLLVVGFYLINLGLRHSRPEDRHSPGRNQQVIENLSGKIGIVLLVLGGMHFLNLIVFSKLRKRGLEPQMPPPFQPTALHACRPFRRNNQIQAGADFQTSAPSTGTAPMKRLYVFYDGECGFCRRCREWLASQPAYFESDLSSFSIRRSPAALPRSATLSTRRTTDCAQR